MLTAKLRQLSLVLGAGRVTLPYPSQPHPPAGERFRGLPTVDGEKCVGCGACAAACPARLITLEEKDHWKVLTADLSRCTYCGRCADVCPYSAFQMTDRFETATTDPARLQVHVALELIRCRECGKPIRTRHMMEQMAAKSGKPVDWSTADICPACRKKAAAQAAQAAAAKAAAQKEGEQQNG